MQYLAHWPEYFQVAESPSGEIMGYSMPFPLTLQEMSANYNVFRSLFQSWENRKDMQKNGTVM